MLLCHFKIYYNFLLAFHVRLAHTVNNLNAFAGRTRRRAQEQSSPSPTEDSPGCTLYSLSRLALALSPVLPCSSCAQQQDKCSIKSFEPPFAAPWGKCKHNERKPKTSLHVLYEECKGDEECYGATPALSQARIALCNMLCDLCWQEQGLGRCRGRSR